MHCVKEFGREITDADAILVVEQGLLSDLLVVYEGAVAALQVLDVETALSADNSSMFPANGRDRDDDLTIGIAAQDETVAVQRYALTFGHAFDYVERRRHQCDPRAV